jgi:cysteinyl-tRNA synthetase
VRTLLAGAHYRSPIDFSPRALDDGRAAWERLATFGRNAAAVVGTIDTSDEGDPSGDGPWREKFTAAISDDFNTPEALAVLYDLVSSANPVVKRAERGDDAARAELASMLDTFSSLAQVLGLSPARDWPQRGGRIEALAPLVSYLLELREEARRAKDFAAADAIRDRVIAAGVVVEDLPGGGARWYLA